MLSGLSAGSPCCRAVLRPAAVSRPAGAARAGHSWGVSALGVRRGACSVSLPRQRASRRVIALAGGDKVSLPQPTHDHRRVLHSGACRLAESGLDTQGEGDDATAEAETERRAPLHFHHLFKTQFRILRRKPMIAISTGCTSYGMLVL